MIRLRREREERSAEGEVRKELATDTRIFETACGVFERRNTDDRIGRINTPARLKSFRRDI